MLKLIQFKDTDTLYVLGDVLDRGPHGVKILQDKTFVLVHAGLRNFTPERALESYDLSELIFYKPNYDKVYFTDKYLVTGHVPTRVAYAGEQGKLVEELLPEERKDCIFYKNKHIVIDCGCSFGGRLGCLCLDTMEEFYI